ncbi:hypothetical protein KEM52_005634 [Ascosphaera acerosa]|nr:hypothetical protein KEM52_005634 [Ascosphaera acerosa]
MNSSLLLSGRCASAASPLALGMGEHAASTALICRRHQTTYQRTKRRLRVKPDATFVPSLSERFDHIVHHPAPSAPSVYHTPTKFLPPNDVRRRLRSAREAQQRQQQQQQQQQGSATATAAGATAPFDATRLPAVQKIKTAPKILTADEVAEIRRLRCSDPLTWSQAKLAKKFGCSPIFVGQICEASPEKKELQKSLLQAIQSSWGAKRTMAREDRELRRQKWTRDA